MRNKKVTITAHCLIRNEERWIWYAIQSVIDFVDKIFVFDTGSTDRTVEIVEMIKNSKLTFEQKGIVNKEQYTKLRQEMLDRTKTSWFMVLDGDEIWPNTAVRELITAVRSAPRQIDAVVVGQWVCQGDVFHFSKAVKELQEDRTGRKGFWLPRAWRKTPGLHAIGEYGVESYADRDGVNVSYWDTKRLKYLTHKFFHMTFLPRSSNLQKDREVMMRSQKTHFYKGTSFPNGMEYPEVFYRKKPDFIKSPWKKLTFVDQLKGLYYRALNFRDRL